MNPSGGDDVADPGSAGGDRAVVPSAGEAPSGAGPASDSPGLTELEHEILAFERKWWRHPGAKEQAIRDTFELSATRYYQLLNALLDNPAALAQDPMVVGRLRRLRQRSPRR